MLKNLTKLNKNKSGASAAEYALIISVLGGFVVGGATLFGGALRTAMGDSGQSVAATVGTDTAFVNP